MRKPWTALLVTALLACGGNSKRRAVAITADQGPAETADRAEPQQQAGATVLSTSGDDLSWLGPVYFAFDSSELTQTTRDRLAQLHAWLSGHARTTLVIEGHCDEQGTTEYNIALGQRRAEGIIDYLVRLGTDPSRLQGVSFGAERPAVDGHDEVAWSKNRRGEFRPSR